MDPREKRCAAGGGGDHTLRGVPKSGLAVVFFLLLLLLFI